MPDERIDRKLLGPMRSHLSHLHRRLYGRMADVNVRKVIKTLEVHVPPLVELRHRARQTYLNARRQPFDHDFQCLAHFDFAPDDLLIDIGANRGQSIDAIRLYHPQQPVAAFEPNPALAMKLRGRCENDPSLVVHNVGLGDGTGEFTLYVPCYNGLDYDAEGALTFGEHQWRHIRESIIGFDRSRMSYRKLRCQVWELDRFNLKARFVKIDTKGFELRVLRGAIKTIRQYHPVLLVANSSPDDVIELLAPMGYGEFHYDGRICQGRGIRNTLYIAPQSVAPREVVAACPGGG